MTGEHSDGAPPRRCACEACGAPADPRSAEPPLCAFCGVNCLPVSTVGGRARRLARPLPERIKAHVAAAAGHEVRETRQRVADAAVRTVAPLLERGVGSLLDRIRRGIGGAGGGGGGGGPDGGDDGSGAP